MTDSIFSPNYSRIIKKRWEKEEKEESGGEGGGEANFFYILKREKFSRLKLKK